MLSVASKKGLIAAGGPDGLVVTSTEAVRRAFFDKDGYVDNIKAFEPELRVQLPTLSQIAFSADENALVVSAQQGGGVAVYHTDGLIQGQISPAIQISTNNTALRALIPNPHPDFTELFALVTMNGDLLIADLKAGQLRPGLSGQVLRNGVSCLSWSNKGKQLVAGLSDGAAAQMRPDGSLVAGIPRPPALEGNRHVSAISWLENDVFFAIYTPTTDSGVDMVPQSDYYIISREKGTSNFLFQRLPEVCAPYGINRTPSFQFITRLRKFPPHLQDLIVVASTSSVDVGLVTKSDTLLEQQQPVVGTYTTTVIQEDSRRAQLPLTSSHEDTSAVGVALDLSSKEGIVNPIPSDPEIRDTATPVPNLLLLNNEGVLVSWWIVYADSIRQKTAYPGLATSGDLQPQQPKTSPQQSQANTTKTTPQVSASASASAFGHSGFTQPAFGAPSGLSGFARPSASSFGARTAGFETSGDANVTFDASPAVPSFGGPKASWATTGFGDTVTPEAGAPTSSQSAFGVTTSLGGGASPTFGTSSSLINRPSPFVHSAASSIPMFGRPGGLGMRPGNILGGSSTSSPFVGPGHDSPKPSGFASFANSKGVSGLDTGGAAGVSPFAKASGDSIFAKPAETNSSKDSSFGATGILGSGESAVQSDQTAGLFGMPGSGLKMETFKTDAIAKDDVAKPAELGSFSLGGLGNMLGENIEELLPAHDKEEDMSERDVDETDYETTDDVRPAPSLPSDTQLAEPSREGTLTPPPSTISESKATPAAPLFSLFGTSTEPDTTPAAVQKSTPSWSFGTVPSTTPSDTPKPKPGLYSVAAGESEENPKVKTEPPSDDEAQKVHDIPEAPLPPNTTSKTTFTPGDGDTSTSSVESNGPPLPSDYLPVNRAANDEVDQTELPDGDDDELSSDFKGSEEDISHPISPIEEPSAEHTEQLHTSPESSFGRAEDQSTEASPTGSLFTKITPLEPAQKTLRPLFGEVGAGPVFPPPMPPESPRSPSPVRHLVPNVLIRPETSRSISAPVRPNFVIDKRKAEAKSGIGTQNTKDRLRMEEERNTAAAKAEAQAKVDMARAEAEEAQQLQDDEDERLRAELMRPVSPSQHLGAFTPYQQNSLDDGTKSGIPGQIEILYQDINSMVDTLGINLRSLSAFLLYQTSQRRDRSWPSLLSSYTPEDALDEEWFLEDILRLHQGLSVLDDLLDSSRITDVSKKMRQCQEVLSIDLVQLRSKLISRRRGIHSQTALQNNSYASLTAEQLSVQHDLRKALTSVRSMLAEAEQNLALLLARLAEGASQSQSLMGTSNAALRKSASQRKPTVEAVTNTINKMTAMAEKKTVDIDILETQFKKLGLHPLSSSGSRQASIEPEDNTNTPQKSRRKFEASTLRTTPTSGAGSVYHTPDSSFNGSARVTPRSGRWSVRSSTKDRGTFVSTEDAERWRERARRKKEIELALKKTFAERRSRKAARNL